MTPQELKNSILQLAIQGKLVEQPTNEECVSIASSYSGDVSNLHEIPDNWNWLAIKDVAYVVTGLSFKKEDQKDSSNGTLRILRGGNIGDDYKYHLYDDDVYVDLLQFQEKYVSLLKGDVITPSVTSMEKICKTGYIDMDLTAITAGGFVYIIRCLDAAVIDSKYLLYFISSSFNKEQCKPNIHKSGQAFYNLKKTGFIEQPILDYITGVMCAVADKSLNSTVGFKGICKKVVILMLVGVAHIVDLHVVGTGSALRSAVICFYLSNEGVSLLENAGHLGLPIPDKLKEILTQLHDRNNKSDG